MDALAAKLGDMDMDEFEIKCLAEMNALVAQSNVAIARKAYLAAGERDRPKDEAGWRRYAVERFDDAPLIFEHDTVLRQMLGASAPLKWQLLFGLLESGERHF